MTGKPVGQSVNRKLMRDFRLYMAVGGMPQAVQAYVDGKNFAEIDEVKREIIRLYESDFKKIDSSGRISMLYQSIPAQLSKNMRRYRISQATGKRKRTRDEELLYDMVDSRTVIISYNTTDPGASMSLTKDLDSYKLYLADTGLFVTLMFIDRPVVENDIYALLLSDKLPANLGYLYENAAAQIIQASGRQPYYHTWGKKGSTHSYEIDFLISRKSRVVPLEVKSSGTGKHESLMDFNRKYSKHVGDMYIVSQKDVGIRDNLRNLPIYMLPFLISNGSDKQEKGQEGNMKKININGYEFAVDYEATAKYYETHSLCDCDECRDYYAQAADKLPELAEFLSEFGADIARPDELSSVDVSGKVDYQFADYTVCGRVEKMGDGKIQLGGEMPLQVSVTEGFSSPNEQEGDYFTLTVTGIILEMGRM